MRKDTPLEFFTDTLASHQIFFFDPMSKTYTRIKNEPIDVSKFQKTFYAYHKTCSAIYFLINSAINHLNFSMKINFIKMG